MRLVLKGFSQQVDLKNPDQIEHFLIFETDKGKEAKLRSPKELIEEVIRLTITEDEPLRHVEENSDPESSAGIPDGATEFSGGDSEPADNVAVQYEPEDPPEETPENEEEVPSV